MQKLEEQIVVRLAKPLRDELERAAQADGRPLSNQVRKILIDFATARITGAVKHGRRRHVARGTEERVA